MEVSAAAHVGVPSGEHAPRSPFAEPSGTGPRPDALRGVSGTYASSAQPPIVVVNAKRSLLWPLVAVALVAVAAGALFLVWQQMQHQQPTSVVITNGSDSRVTEAGSNVVVVGPNRPDRPDRAVVRSRSMPIAVRPSTATRRRGRAS